MIWRIDKPTEGTIVAKLSDDFCGGEGMGRFVILHLVKSGKPSQYEHYEEDFEEVPYSAIDKWASLEDDEIEANDRKPSLPKWRKRSSLSHWAGEISVDTYRREFRYENYSIDADKLFKELEKE